MRKYVLSKKTEEIIWRVFIFVIFKGSKKLKINTGEKSETMKIVTGEK